MSLVIKLFNVSKWLIIACIITFSVSTLMLIFAFPGPELTRVFLSLTGLSFEITIFDSIALFILYLLNRRISHQEIVNEVK